MESNEKRNEIVRIFRRYARLGLGECGLNPIQVYKKSTCFAPRAGQSSICLRFSILFDF